MFVKKVQICYTKSVQKGCQKSLKMVHKKFKKRCNKVDKDFSAKILNKTNLLKFGPNFRFVV